MNTDIAVSDNDDAEPMPDHDSVVADWQQHAKENDDINFQFLRSLKRRSYGFRRSEERRVGKECA